MISRSTISGLNIDISLSHATHSCTFCTFHPSISNFIPYISVRDASSSMMRIFFSIEFIRNCFKRYFYISTVNVEPFHSPSLSSFIVHHIFARISFTIVSPSPVPLISLVNGPFTCQNFSNTLL